MKSGITAIVAAVTLMATAAIAGDEAKHMAWPLGTLLDDVALNAAAASRTFTVGPTIGPNNNQRLFGFSTVVLDVAYTYANTGTLTFTCTGTGLDSSTADKTLTTCTTASGTCTLNWAGSVVTPSLSASKKFVFPLGVGALQAITCVVAHSGTPSASDKITVVGTAIADGGGCP
jgi:hypothetical protein